MQAPPLLRLTQALQRVLLALGRGASTRGLRLGAFAALALAAAWTPLSQVGGLNDFRDAHLLSSYEIAAVKTVLEFRQLPLWDPWACGGLYALGNPQTRFASPTLLFSLALGERRAEALVVFLFILLGLEGAFRFLRQQTRSALGAAIAAPLFALNGFYALAWSLGWVNFLGFELLPWALWGLHGLVRGRLAAGLLIACAFAVMIGFGGTYAVPLCSVVIALEGIRALQQPRGGRARLQAVFRVAGAAALTAAACAFRLWPIVENMGSAPRIMGGRPAHDLAELSRMALWIGDGGTDAIFFMGPAALLALCAPLRWRRAAFPIAMLALLVWLASGYATNLSSFAVLRALPLFNVLRYPERFLIPGSLYLAELSALGLASVVALARRRPKGVMAAVALCGVALAGASTQAVEMGALASRAQMVPATPTVAQPFAQARGNRWASDYFLAMERGSIACGEAYPVPMSEHLSGDLPQEEYLADATAGAARRVSWSPNQVEVSVDVARPVELLVNQNWHPGWTSTVGEVVSRDGLLAVALPAGRHEVLLRFLPRSGIGGTLVSALALAAGGAALLLSRRRRMPRAFAAAAGIPLAVWLGLLLAWKQPTSSPVLTNADGAPIVVDALPAEAKAVHAHWAQPVELVGAVLPKGPGDDGQVHFRLYWKVSGEVAHTLGIFAHLEGPTGTFKQVDHEPVANTYFLHEAPQGVLLRDDFGADTTDYEAGTWQVRVGLWNARGDSSRVAVSDPAGNAVTEERLSIGTFSVPAKDGGVDAGP